MIFSNFFKAKWQNNNSHVRITAINNDLEPNNTEHFAILTRLAQQDDNELVRRTALIKIASFDVWLHESKNNSHKKVKDFAQMQVTKILTGEQTNGKNSISLSDDAKLNYIETADTLVGLEAWLLSETNEKIVIALFNKINKAALLIPTFSQKQQPDIQRHLLAQVTEKPLLEKLIKKACNDEIIAEINSKITEIERLLALPKAISKRAQLNLSKFLALTDIADYGVMLTKKEELLAQWSIIVAEFDWLPTEEKGVFINKHATINNQLEKIFSPKAEAYQQQLIAEKRLKKQQQAKVLLKQEIDKVSESLAQSILEHTDVDETTYHTIFIQLTQQINDSVLNTIDKKHFLVLVEQLQYKLTQLPLIAQSITEATQLIAKISQLALPINHDEFNQRQPIYNDWLTQWKLVEKQAADALPESITHAKKEITTTWNAALATFISEQKKQLTQAQKKIAELKRLISSGKYNTAFGVFKRIEKTVEQLSDKQKLRIQKDYGAVSAKMAELSDWEHYIATPRKQKLLEEIQELVNTPLDNPNEQAAKVKEYRKTWNSLGHADDEIERELNNQFNTYCEQAFAPCRLFYKEQEKIREQHLAARLAVLADVKNFAQSYDQEPIDWKNIDIQLNKFQQKWQSAGEVERSQYKDIQAQYKVLIEPIKKHLRTYHDDNAVLKKALIDNAKQAAENTDVLSAINTVKDLQNQWKSTGHSGAKHENKLWKEFRTLNDAIFKKRDELNATTKLQKQTILDQLNTQLDDLQITTQASNNNIIELQTAKSCAQAMLTQAIEIKPVNKKFVSKIETFLLTVEGHIVQIKTNKDKQQWQAIFTLLENIATGISIDELQASTPFKVLSTAWKKRLTDVMQSSAQVDRSEDTLKLEILTGKESPEQYKAERMQVQVALMQEQMLSGNAVDLQANLLSWMQKGGMSKADLVLIARIKPIYC